MEDLKQIKEGVMKLWNQSFDDGEAFTQLYFDSRYADDRNIFIEENNKIVSALQMIPYPMSYYGETLSTSYISGACTAPNRRGEGLMTQLLEDTLKEMHKNDVQIATLIPAEDSLADYYNRFGFTWTFDYSIHHLSREELTNVKGYEIEPFTEYREDVYQYFNQKMQERPLCIQHTSDDFDFIRKTAALENDLIYIARQSNQIKGILFCTPGNHTIVVKELLADSEFSKDALLSYVIETTGAEFIRQITFPGIGTEDYKLGMARVLDVHFLLTKYAAAHPEIQICLEISDTLLPANSGVYTIKAGSCIKEDVPIKEGAISISVATLTQLIMGYHPDKMEPEFRLFPPATPYMSLMVND